MTKINLFRIIAYSAACVCMLLACGAGKGTAGDSATVEEAASRMPATLFSADSAYYFAGRQVAFGPRVPGSESHAKCGDWLSAQLRKSGAEVSEQTATLTTFDGTRIPMRNIFARINPEKQNRILLFAHWDTRPWADHDPDPAKRKTPIDGANDGASGTAVLLEIARALSQQPADAGVDILLCDAEDWGTENNDESWAMGARYFAQNLPSDGYMPKAAILVDMVGAPDATFLREYFSQRADPSLAEEIWAIGNALGHGNLFQNRMGSAINDDHVELIKAGIPAIDIIDYREGDGFFSGWHTTADNMDAIAPSTLGAVGEVLETYIRRQH